MNKNVLKQRGFSLIEVMIGIMILTIAIVSAAGLLVNLQKSNQINLQTVQAYYYAVEGLEAVRNIRDTNWLHNRSWMGADSSEIWVGSFDFTNLGNDANSQEYQVVLQSNAWTQGADIIPVENFNFLRRAAPWEIKVENGDGDPIEMIGNDSSAGDSVDFIRSISFRTVDGMELDEAILVESKVSWEFKNNEYNVVLSEILTNWKDGVF